MFFPLSNLHDSSFLCPLLFFSYRKSAAHDDLFHRESGARDARRDFTVARTSLYATALLSQCLITNV